MSSSRSSIDEICILCQQSLRIQIDDEDSVEVDLSTTTYIYDDVELPCHHHIHYDCARDLYDQSIHPITTCPHCSHSLLTPAGQLLVTVRNEGGTTDHFDLGADLADQKEIASDPILARNEAFLSFCFSQDHEAMEELLSSNDADTDTDVGRDAREVTGRGADVDAVQRKTGMTGLHLCALNNDAHGIRLLLRHGARRDVRGLDGCTPLALAFSEGSHDAAYALQ